MRLIHDVAELRSVLRGGRRIAFVPTMGNLHQGHLQLVREARRLVGDGLVVVSVFVNPLQFGPDEDFERYPRTLSLDCEQLQALTDVVFAPEVKQMYPLTQTMFVTPPPIADQLCGAARPGHFRGVATVVLKLFNIVQPDIALFGKKDYQQLLVIRQLVAQFNLPLQIVGSEIVREADGLALSSRNQYLSVEQRRQAIQLNQALSWVVQCVEQGERDFSGLEQQASRQLQRSGWQVDYVAIRCQQDLSSPTAETSRLVILAAASLGNTRLLDNIELTLAV